MLSKEYLLSQLAQLEQQFEQLKSNVHAQSGAIQYVKFLLGELEQLEAKAAEIKDHVENKVESAIIEPMQKLEAQNDGPKDS